MGPKLLKPKKVSYVVYPNLTWNQTRKIISAHKKKRMGILEAAYEVEQIGNDAYHVRMEYFAK